MSILACLRLPRWCGGICFKYNSCCLVLKSLEFIVTHDFYNLSSRAECTFTANRSLGQRRSRIWRVLCHCDYPNFILENKQYLIVYRMRASYSMRDCDHKKMFLFKIFASEINIKAKHTYSDNNRD